MRTRKNRKSMKTSPKSSKRVFGETHYNSGNGMLTTVWGPSMWHCLHTISFNYPVNPTEENKKQYRDFILSLRHVLPCGKCRKNLYKNFKKLPLTMKQMESRDTFSKYVYELHELINRMLNKNSGLSYDDVKERYEIFRARCKPNVPKNKTVKKRREKGCTEPIQGEKSKCVLHIVPVKTKGDTFQIDKKCEPK